MPGYIRTRLSLICRVLSFYRVSIFLNRAQQDEDAYLLAGLAGWEKLNLLPGEANIILEGTYVGKTYLDPNSASDNLDFTPGHDNRVVIKRQKLEDFSTVKISWEQ